MNFHDNEISIICIANGIAFTLLFLACLLFDVYAPLLGLGHYSGDVGFWQGVLTAILGISAFVNFVMATRWHFK